MKRPGVPTVIGLVLTGCLLAGILLPGSPLVFFAVKRAIAFKFSGVRQITPEALVVWMRNPGDRRPPLLIDARSEAEYRISHIEGAVRIDPVQPDLEPVAAVGHRTPVVVYCATGIRASALAEALRQERFDEVANLEGGIFEWANEGRPLVDERGPVSYVHPYDDWWGRLLKPQYRAPMGR
jgi:rhodanese-related sulfurtransferase